MIKNAKRLIGSLDQLLSLHLEWAKCKKISGKYRVNRLFD